MLLITRSAMVLLAAIAAFILAAPPLEARNFMWKVSAKNGAEAYIMGSIHLAHSGLYPLRDPIMKAFESSRALVVEIDTEALPPGAMNQYVSAHGLAKDSRPLPDRLSPATREALLASGYYHQGLDRFTPWLAAMTIQLEAMRRHGFEAEYGLDKYFIGQAKGLGRPVLELETLDEQMGMLAAMGETEADLFLRSVILEMDELPRTMRAFLDTWNGGDVGGFSRVFFREYDKYPELVPLLDKIIIRRNGHMAARIHRLLNRKGPLFIVVGAGHLVGEESVLALLAARGHVVSQL